MHRILLFLLLAASGVLPARAQFSSPYITNPELNIGYVDSCAVFWEDSWDAQGGGWYTDVNRQGQPTGSAKNMLTQARNAYGYVRAFMLTGNEAWLDRAEQGLAWLAEHGWDEEYGGWFSQLDSQGEPVNPWAGKNAFDQHYALLGYAAAIEATAGELWLEAVEEGSAWLEEHFWDDRPGLEGYYDNVSRTGLNPVGKSFNATVDAVTTHVLLSQLMGLDPGSLERLEELCGQMIDHLVGSMPGQAIGFAEVFDADWNVDNGETMTIMGHVLKTSWCLGRVYRLTGNPEYLDAARTLFDEVWDNGYDHDYGGPYKDYNRLSGEMLMWGNPDTTKAWWQMEQGVMAGLMLQGLDPSPDYLEMAQGSSAFFMEHFVDHVYGEVYADRTRRGEETWGTTKGNGYKAGYHSMELGYYTYLYSSLLLHGEEARLFYRFEHSDEPRVVRLSPIAHEAGSLEILSVMHEGEPWSAFDAETLLVDLPAGSGGVFEVVFTPVETGVEGGDDRPTRPALLSLAAPYPNPFNGRVQLPFTLVRALPVQLRLFDLRGAMRLQLDLGQLPAGFHEQPIELDGLSSGRYWIELRAGGERRTRSLLLLK